MLKLFQKKKPERAVSSLNRQFKNRGHVDLTPGFKKSMPKYLNSFKDVSVLVVGDVGIDRYTQGTVERISPEAPVPILLVHKEFLKLGLAANVAENVRSMGGKATLLGVCGKDRDSEDLKQLMKTSGLSTRALVEDPKRRTTLKERIVTDQQQLFRVDYENKNALTPSVREKVMKLYQRQIELHDIVILEDYAKGVIDSLLAASIFDLAKKKGKLVLSDPKNILKFYTNTGLIKPNKSEAEKLTGISIQDDATLFKAGQKMLADTQAEYVVITRGSEGMAVFRQGSKKVTSIPTFAREVYDVSGAGDTVMASLALMLARKNPIEDACLLANIAAGIVVGKRGTATVTPKEILESASSR